MLAGCGRNSTISLSKFSELIESELDEINLTIYYSGFSFRTSFNWSLEHFIEVEHDYRFVITGKELAEHRDLLNQLASVELVPSKSNSFVDARLYYVFEHAEYGEIFSFLTYVLGGGAGNFDFVLVNGQQVMGNRILFEAIFPFLPERIVNEIQVNIDAWPPGGE